MMTHSIFIKSYRRDFPFLKYCLQSIDKFCSGFKETVVVVPFGDKATVESWGHQNVKVIGIKEYGDGYMFQQVVKLKAYTYCIGSHILFVDSDCVFTRPSTPENFMIEGKPLLLRTRYDEPGMPVFWQDATEKACGFRSEWEYMRRHPMMHLAEVLHELPEMEQYIMNVPGRHFSEFNYIGQMIERNYSHLYHIQDTKDGVPEAHLKQFWSWHEKGAAAYEEEIKQILA